LTRRSNANGFRKESDGCFVVSPITRALSEADKSIEAGGDGAGPPTALYRLLPDGSLQVLVLSETMIVGLDQAVALHVSPSHFEVTRVEPAGFE